MLSHALLRSAFEKSSSFVHRKMQRERFCFAFMLPTNCLDTIEMLLASLYHQTDKQIKSWLWLNVLTFLQRICFISEQFEFQFCKDLKWDMTCYCGIFVSFNVDVSISKDLSTSLKTLKFRFTSAVLCWLLFTRYTK